MTYAKFGSEFPDYLAAAGLSDAAFRTHAEASMWVYHVEAWDLRIPKHMLVKPVPIPSKETTP
jgi:hypothetical protein